ncbi:uncharacterized protein LOC115621101 [Scaptodrosophila lebanonensis]|uniref:Uncharacterized protein LOC115621101 n=1 Tax=Drosophila lebanonensis TaxID=7225 RepID=A0A6J2T5E5_DROLE|nr:uncharacterized protein LOC115621101 [Scaptodrosophila lebanonensis]
MLPLMRFRSVYGYCAIFIFKNRNVEQWKPSSDPDTIYQTADQGHNIRKSCRPLRTKMLFAKQYVLSVSEARPYSICRSQTDDAPALTLPKIVRKVYHNCRTYSNCSPLQDESLSLSILELLRLQMRILCSVRLRASNQWFPKYIWLLCNVYN